TALGIPHPFQNRYLADLGRLQVVPEDSPRPLVLALDLDHGARGRDQVDREVVGDHRQVAAQDLDRVDGGGDRRVIVDLAGVDQDPVLEIVVAAALADPGSTQVHRHRPGENKVDFG